MDEQRLRLVVTPERREGGPEEALRTPMRQSSGGKIPAGSQGIAEQRLGAQVPSGQVEPGQVISPTRPGGGRCPGRPARSEALPSIADSASSYLPCSREAEEVVELVATAGMFSPSVLRPIAMDCRSSDSAPRSPRGPPRRGRDCSAPWRRPDLVAPRLPEDGQACRNSDRRRRGRRGAGRGQLVLADGGLVVARLRGPFGGWPGIP